MPVEVFQRNTVWWHSSTGSEIRRGDGRFPHKFKKIASWRRARGQKYHAIVTKIAPNFRENEETQLGMRQAGIKSQIATQEIPVEKQFQLRFENINNQYFSGSAFSCIYSDKGSM